MISGVHAIVYSKEAEKLRAFFKDVLEWPFVDAGHGWLIFALPPAELGVHPALLQAVGALLGAHDFAHPRLTATQLGVKAELHGAVRLALESAEAALV